MGSITGGTTLPICVVFSRDLPEAFGAPMSGLLMGLCSIEFRIFREFFRTSQLGVPVSMLWLYPLAANWQTHEDMSQRHWAVSLSE
jgi:hypothetical protein